MLLTWFPGQEGGAALADVLLGEAEPGGRLPTTWPAEFADAPVTEVTPTAGALEYREGLFIGYRAYEKQGIAPAFPFGHGLGYTQWEYESLEVTPTAARVRLTNTGTRPGRETVQIYLAPVATAFDGAQSATEERPASWLAGFASVSAGPGESVETEIALPARAFEIWDEEARAWRSIGGAYEVRASHSHGDTRLTAPLDL